MATFICKTIDYTKLALLLPPQSCPSLPFPSLSRPSFSTSTSPNVDRCDEICHGKKKSKSNTRDANRRRNAYEPVLFFSLSLCLFSYLLSKTTQYVAQLPPTWIGRLCVSGFKQEVLVSASVDNPIFLVVGFSAALSLYFSHIRFAMPYTPVPCKRKKKERKQKKKTGG
ncbi:hypothetical protein F4809DRAFT_156073 [Biscogniauxia mediterranea]|nr:hypothetical protein F4809DRAFT_156073 [Biscogniauxia mediterranea]